MRKFINTQNLDDVLQLGEGQYIEFKESFDKSFVKEIVAFANASGGIIYLGITDSNAIKGVSVTNRLKSQVQDIAHNCDPSILISINEINNVLAVGIKEGNNKPYSCSAGFYMRMGANSQKMNRNDILALAIKSGKTRFDEQICNGFDWKNFDNERFQYYLKLAGISNNLSKEEILKNLRVLTNDGFTNAGALFFAKEPYKYIISSKIRCVHFNDDKRIDILDKKVIDKGIIGNIEFAVEYLRERVPVRYKINKLARDEFPEYPIEAYREAIVNAVIHFDYFLGDTIAIEKLKSSIVVNNKGELLFPKKDFGKRSEARNRLLADLLSRTEYMEKAGTGIQRVKDACSSNGNKILFDFTDSFWVTIETNENVTENVTENREQSILNLIFTNKYITTTKLAQMLNVNRRTIARDIESLKNQGKLIRVGGDKGGYWDVIYSKC
jgi:ATP-dependent DNA helicase RecG